MPAKNIPFILFDQLRFDDLSCAGHPTLHRPHIDAIAERGLHLAWERVFRASRTRVPVRGVYFRV